MIQEKLRKLRAYATVQGVEYAEVLRAFTAKLTANVAVYEAKIERTDPESPDFLAFVQHRDELRQTIELLVGELDAVRNLNGG